MKDSTLEAVNAMLRTDDSISAAERARIAVMLRRSDKPVQKQPAEGPAIMRRHEVADELSCCLRTVDNLAVQGILQKVKFPGRVRGCGFRRSDVQALIGEAE